MPMNMKFNFPDNFGILTFEGGRDRPVIVDRPWIDDLQISTDSWCYVQDQKYRPVNEILHGFIDRVSRGGGLLLSLCPKADGTIGTEQKQILLSMGKWLTQNGQAIYGTRP
jgi:alpha-L-fucosidase